jgi:DNA-binding transcriptional LysR family regulator
MDKLRALEYFSVAAEEHSFTGAARRLGVTTPAIVKLVNTLERSLGAALFDRTARGLTLTADGQNYLETCQPALEQLASADELITRATVQPRGIVVVGTPTMIGQHCILPALPKFHARYPDIQVEFCDVKGIHSTDAKSFDVIVSHHWPEHADFVKRALAPASYLVCASPGYWAANGVPKHPRDLERHNCVGYRNFQGTIYDLWKFEKDGKEESVAANSWFVTDDRDTMLDAVIAGHGIGRFLDLTTRGPLRSGLLVAALLDWESLESPTVELLYRPAHRRTPRIRAFIDFVSELFLELSGERKERVEQLAPRERPRWLGRNYRRTSAATPRGRS